MEIEDSSRDFDLMNRKYDNFLLIAVGILGQYLTGIYTEVKYRPLYIVKEEE